MLTDMVLYFKKVAVRIVDSGNNNNRAGGRFYVVWKVFIAVPAL